MTLTIDRCYHCGGNKPNGPLPMPGECSCLICEDCGKVMDPDEGYCVPCDNREPVPSSSGESAGEFQARMHHYQRDLKR